MAAAKIQVKRANAAAWTSANTVLFAGEIGLELDTFKFKIGNGSTAWNSLAYSISSNLSASTLNDLGDVTITSAADGDFLRWNGTAWINDAVNLSTDTIGSYVQSLVAGTGVTLANNSGEGATPTVTVDTTVIQARVTNVTDTEIGYLDGVTSAIQTQIDAKAPLASPTFTGTVTLPANTVALGTTTTGDYVSSLVAGTGVTLSNNSGETATPTVAIGQAVGTSASVTFAAVTAPLIGNASTATALQTARNIAGQSFDGSANISIAPTDLTGVTSTAAELNILDGATLSTVELNYVDGVTSAIQTQLDTKAPLASPTFTGTVTIPTGASITAPTGLVKGDVGLGNVDNTSDANKPVSTATQTALDLKAPLASPTFTGTVTIPTGASITAPTGLVKGDVGLGNVDNTSDANKPVSTAGQTALDLKANIASPTFTGTVVLPDNTVALGTKTTGDYVATITGGTGVTSSALTSGEGTTHSLSIGQAVGTTDNVTFAGVTADAIKVGVTGANEIDTTSGDLTIDSAGGTVTIDDNLTVTGNLTVSGTTTSINTETLTVDDNTIVLNNNATGAPSANAGIEVERGSSTNVELRWNETSDKWEITENGSTYSDIATVSYVDAQTINTLDEIGDVSISSASAGQFLKWNGTAWVNDAVPIISNIDDITGVTITAAADKDFLMYNGTAWVDSPITLGTDTTGSYVTSLVAGTGVTLANNSGEGATPTVTVDTTVIQAKVANVTDTEIGYLDGVTSAIQTQMDLKAPLASPTFTGTPTLPTGTIATTQTAADSTTKVATTAFVTTALSLVTDSTTLLDGGNAFTIQYNSLGPVINAGSI